MPGCAAIGCNNRSEKGHTMKCFPRDPYLRAIWKQRVGRADWEPSNNSFLCHVHFEKSQWVVTPSGRIKLKKGAIPSIFTVTSTRKSPKKKQKLGVTPVEKDLEEYEVEYLENECPFIFNMNNQKIVPNIISVQSQDSPTVSGQILQNVKFISSDALKDLQNENIIIVADENNREIGKIINDNGFALLGNERGKENVQVKSKLDKPVSTFVKIEVKEEILDNNSSTPDYDEIERKLQEICHSENEIDSPSIKDLAKKLSSQSVDTESTFSLDDLENGSESTKESSNQETDPDLPTIRTGTKRKRKSKLEPRDQKHTLKTSQSADKMCEIKFTEDVSDIINDLEEESLAGCHRQPTKHVANIISVRNNQMKSVSKPVIKNDVKLKLQNDTVDRSVNIDNTKVNNKINVKSHSDLIAKLNVQGEAIETLTNQLILYKDMEHKMKSLSQELESKNEEIEALRKAFTKKSQTEKKFHKSDNIDLKDASETDLRNRIDFLEDSNKKLMKTVTLDAQNRRKLECQIKSRDNQMKELNWKLEKASKFLDRAEKNANTYRKKMLNMQALIRRKKLCSEKNSIFDEFLASQSNQEFSMNTMKMALEIEKSCGIEGYQKLLNCDFPLPTLYDLSKQYPTEIDYYDQDEEVVLVNKASNSNDHEILLSETKMENVEYLDPELLDENSGTMTGTVQDIFDESSDSEEFNLNELKKHIMIDLTESS